MLLINNNSHDQLEKSINDINWKAYLKKSFTKSPVDWEDQILYFLMLDRFSDNNEAGHKDIDDNVVLGGTTPMFNFEANAGKANFDNWSKAGGKWCGGNLKGLKSKLGYLKRLGITAVWISPVFKQVSFDNGSYHGYGIQNFLDVDPHFGTRQDLRDFVKEAHNNGIYVILDIILNHSGNVFSYCDGEPGWDSNIHEAKYFRNAFGQPVIPMEKIDLAKYPNAWPNDATWPAELQNKETFTRKGYIRNWDYDPEYYEGDFSSLKDINHGYHERNENGERIFDKFHAFPALKHLCDCYKFWIAYADIDGFRVDTVKHMEIGGTRLFCNSIYEFAQSIGKENFFIVGEITGGRERAFHTMRLTGLSAALGIDDVQDKLEYLSKGYRNPTEYFNLFRNSIQESQRTHAWFGKHIVTQIDDHDKVSKGNNKERFCSHGGYDFIIPVIGLNLTTAGISCLYYGTEQGFAGCGNNDKYIRECMFGGKFGAFQSEDAHFFNEDHPVYSAVSQIAHIRENIQAIRRGRQYLREISVSGDEGTFGLPHMIGNEIRSIVPWSRIFNDTEVVCSINTDKNNARENWVTVDASLHKKGDEMTCIYSNDPDQIGSKVYIKEKNGKSIYIKVPAAGFVIFE